MKDKSILILILVMSLIIFSQEAYAVGLGSYSGELNTQLDFIQGLKKTFSYIMVSSAQTVMDYEVIVEGAFPEYFTLSNNLIKNVWPGQTKSFSATLQFPEQKPSAGLHETRICVAEASSGGGSISVRAKVCSIIGVRVLYSEKYLKIESFDVPNIDVGDTLNLKISVKSWTEASINNVRAVIDIFGPSEKGFSKKITTVQTEEKPLASNEALTLSASLDTRNFESGEYNAVATVYYDSKDANMSSKFKIGILAVKVVNYTKEFTRNKVNRFNIDVESRWNSLIENVYADVRIENETLRTPSITLQPWEISALSTYWETTDKKAQYYDGKLILYFAGNSTEQDIRVKMLVDPEEIKRLMVYVSITTGIVILIAIIVMLSLRKPKGNKYEKTKKK
ncbi:hypothetical protein J4433_01090 [Candidatus Pacearchaeota archaeon]|nr:hypothetical protein [Candidatus Pacearchaeota archaeon]